jgi:hypothetical protein
MTEGAGFASMPGASGGLAPEGGLALEVCPSARSPRNNRMAQTKQTIQQSAPEKRLQKLRWCRAI